MVSDERQLQIKANENGVEYRRRDRGVGEALDDRGLAPPARVASFDFRRTALHLEARLRLPRLPRRCQSQATAPIRVEFWRAAPRGSQRALAVCQPDSPAACPQQHSALGGRVGFVPFILGRRSGDAMGLSLEPTRGPRDSLQRGGHPRRDRLRSSGHWLPVVGARSIRGGRHLLARPGAAVSYRFTAEWKVNT